MKWDLQNDDRAYGCYTCGKQGLKKGQRVSLVYCNECDAKHIEEVRRAALATASPHAPPILLQDFNAKSGFGVFVVTGEHQRTAFFTRAAAEQYLAQQDPERFKIVMYPKPPAATQEQPAGSVASEPPFTVPDSLPGHAMTHQGHWVRGAQKEAADILASLDREKYTGPAGKLMQPGSPRKVGEVIPEELWQVVKRLYERFHHGSFTNWPAIANRLDVWLAARPSSAPVGEQK